MCDFTFIFILFFIVNIFFSIANVFYSYNQEKMFENKDHVWSSFERHCALLKGQLMGDNCDLIKYCLFSASYLNLENDKR